MTHLEDLLLIELLWKALNGGQSLTTIALCKVLVQFSADCVASLTLDADVDVVLGLLVFPSIVVGLRERV